MSIYINIYSRKWGSSAHMANPELFKAAAVCANTAPCHRSSHEKCRKHCNWNQLEVLQLMEENAWLEQGRIWSGRSRLSWKICKVRLLCSYTASASTMREKVGYVLRTENSRFCCERHSGTCTQSPPVPDFSWRNWFWFLWLVVSHSSEVAKLR